MNKLRASGLKTRKVSKWDVTSSQRKSMSLHDLSVSESPIDPLFHQNSSLMTLDSIPKSRDSGLSRSASRLSLASTGHVLAESDTPRSPTKCDLKSKNRELERINRDLKRQLRKKDESLKDQKFLYQTLFAEHQDLKLKFAKYQNDVDRFRVQMYSKNPPPQDFFTADHRNSLEDKQQPQQITVTHERRGSPDSETSFSQTTTDGSFTTMTNNTRTSEEESADDPTELHKECIEVESIALSYAPSSSSSLASHPELQLLAKSAGGPLHQSSPLPLHLLSGPCRSEGCAPSPGPSLLSQWTLDKSFKLVSDSDRSEAGEDEEDKESSNIESRSTEETGMNSLCKSEETLKAVDFDESHYVSLHRIIPKSASIGSLNDKKFLINALPQDSFAEKVERWRISVGDTFPSKNLEQAKRPQNLPINGSPMFQRSSRMFQWLKSPQNISLISPRPYYKQGTVTPIMVARPSAPVVPPLDLSALMTDSSSSAREEVSGRQPSSDSAHLKDYPSTSREKLQQKQLDKFCKMAQKNMDLSRSLLKHFRRE